MKTAHIKRIRTTIAIIEENVPVFSSIFDIGQKSKLSEEMSSCLCSVTNQPDNEDLNLNPEVISNYNNFDVTTCFEVLEHLFNPGEIIRRIKTDKLIFSVPLKMPFSKCYKGRGNRDWHFNEFEPWQIYWLFNTYGWTITDVKYEYQSIIGIRPLINNILRKPRWMIGVAERSQHEER